MFRVHGSGILIGICFFLLAQISAAQQDTLEKTFYYENGAVSSVGMMHQGKPIGYWKTYYENGLLRSEGNRVDYLLSGTWKFYNEGEDLVKEIKYEAGKKNGPTRIYNDSCELVTIEPYRNDTLHGVVKQFHPASQAIRSTTPYRFGQRDGVAYEFDTTGRIITIITYQHGFIKKKEEINRQNKLGKQGTWKEWYPDSTLHREMRYKNDVLHGYYKEYDKSGKLIAALLYIDGIIQENPEELTALDVRREYYDNGVVKWEGTYNYQGEEEGTFKSFARNGDVEEAKIYSKGILLAEGKLNKKGERTGPWKFFYPDGSKRALGDYKDGLKVGAWEYFHANGALEQKGKYNKDGKPHGEWNWWYSNGQIWREENFWKGKEDGEVVDYSPEGIVITRGQYIDGKKDGDWFYELGDHREEGKYIEGNRSGEWIYYYPDGKINFKGGFLNGDPHGRHVYYYPGGRIKREEYYELGYEEGTWRSYDEYGNLVLTSQFEGGQEVKLDKKKLR